MKQFNLQFFADDVDTTDIDTGVEESVSAEPMEVEDDTNEGESENVEETTEEPEEEKPVDVNAIAAAARRKAESEARNAQAQKDAEIVRRFGHLKNPITGNYIRSEKDYWDALDAQEQLKSEAELREKGIDPRMIQEAVQRNPVVVQASQYLAQANEREAMAEIENDVKALSEIDSSIHSLHDVHPDVVRYAIDHQVPLTDAYKVMNYGKMTSAKEEAIRQGAINQARNKAHLNPINGVATQDNSVDIPQSERKMWEAMFPNKTWAERRELYNEAL